MIHHVSDVTYETSALESESSEHAFHQSDQVIQIRSLDFFLINL